MLKIKARAGVKNVTKLYEDIVYNNFKTFAIFYFYIAIMLIRYLREQPKVSDKKLLSLPKLTLWTCILSGTYYTHQAWILLNSTEG